MRYEDWISEVMQKPFGAGRAGVGLVLSTVVALILAFALFAKPFFGSLPSGHYPRIVLMLPFLLAAMVVFFGLSPIFYNMHLKDSR